MGSDNVAECSPSCPATGGHARGEEQLDKSRFAGPEVEPSLRARRNICVGEDLVESPYFVEGGVDQEGRGNVSRRMVEEAQAKDVSFGFQELRPRHVEFVAMAETLGSGKVPLQEVAGMEVFGARPGENVDVSAMRAKFASRLRWPRTCLETRSRARWPS